MMKWHCTGTAVSQNSSQINPNILNSSQLLWGFTLADTHTPHWLLRVPIVQCHHLPFCVSNMPFWQEAALCQLCIETGCFFIRACWAINHKSVAWTVRTVESWFLKHLNFKPPCKSDLSQFPLISFTNKFNFIADTSNPWFLKPIFIFHGDLYFIFKWLHLGFREMDADPTQEQDPSGVNDAALMDTDNQQKSDMFNPGIGDEAGVSTSVENTTAQENCPSISDAMHEESVDFGNKADDSMESILEDTNVRFKNRF